MPRITCGLSIGAGYLRVSTVHDKRIYPRQITCMVTLANKFCITVKPVLRDHCHERPPVLTDHAFSAGPTFQYNLTCHQRPPVLTDHIFVANGLVFQNRFHCICLVLKIEGSLDLNHNGFLPLHVNFLCIVIPAVFVLQTSMNVACVLAAPLKPASTPMDHMSA